MASQNTYTTAPDSNYPRRFPFTFPSLDSSEVYVSVAGTPKTVGASNDYTVGNYNTTSGGYIEFVSDTTRGTGTVRIYRTTDGSILKRNFQAGSAIKADDLNVANKQAIYIAEEARQGFVNLASSGTSSGFAIDGENIAPDSITSNKIKDLEVKADDLSSSTTDDTKRAVTTNHIRDNAVTTAKIANDAVTGDKIANGTITNGNIANGTIGPSKLQTSIINNSKVASDAAIAGSKISPTFTSDVIISNTHPELFLNDTDNNFSFKIENLNGVYKVRDETNDQSRLTIASDGTVTIPGNLDVNSGLDITGTCTATTFSGSGASLTNLPASALTGSLPTSQSGVDLSGLVNLRHWVEFASTGTSNTSSSNYQTKVSISVNTTANSRVLVFYSFEHKHSNTNNHKVRTRIAASTGFVGGNIERTNSGTSYASVTGHALDISSHNGNRTYTISFRRDSQGTAYIQNAYIAAVAFQV